MVATEVLRSYYQSYFPADQIYSWLSYGDPVYFTKREFAFTRGDFFTRYQSFKNGQELKDRLCKNERDIPERFEIGCVYTVPPSQQHSVSPGMFLPNSKEYVLDIDISDYNDVRLCGCKESGYCRTCWPIMLCGMEVADYVLGDVFGFKHKMWVFSGGRGIHCWVGDESVRSMGNEGRVAITEFMHLYQGAKEGNKENGSGKVQGRVDINSVQHPTFSKNSRVFQICHDYFVNVFIEGMGLLDSDKRDRLLSFIDDSTLRKSVVSKMDKDWSELEPAKQWKNIIDYISNPKNQSNKWYVPYAQSIVYSFIYPRLDVNVSKALNHLLKGPFCIHPRTGYVCVPLSVEHDIKNSTFYPADQCPNVKGLIEHGSQDAITKMKERLGMFKKFVGNLVRDQATARREDNDAMDF